MTAALPRAVTESLAGSRSGFRAEIA